MSTQSSPWTEEHGGSHSMRLQKSQTQLSYWSWTWRVSICKKSTREVDSCGDQKEKRPPPVGDWKVWVSLFPFNCCPNSYGVRVQRFGQAVWVCSIPLGLRFFRKQVIQLFRKKCVKTQEKEKSRLILRKMSLMHAWHFAIFWDKTASVSKQFLKPQSSWRSEDWKWHPSKRKMHSGAGFSEDSRQGQMMAV